MILWRCVWTIHRWLWWKRLGSGAGMAAQQSEIGNRVRRVGGTFVYSDCSGDFQLLYYYTDSRGCWTGIRRWCGYILLPSTDFTVAPQSCIHTDGGTHPLSLARNTFSRMDSSATIRLMGYRTTRSCIKVWHVRLSGCICMAQSVYGCRDSPKLPRLEDTLICRLHLFRCRCFLLQGWLFRGPTLTVDPDT